MRFLQILNKKKFVLLSFIFLFYILLNMLDGNRGLISYFEKKKEKTELIKYRNMLEGKLSSIEHKINLLSGTVDMDYLETLYRKNFMVGKKEEIIYNIVKE